MRIVFIGCVMSSELFLNKLIEMETDIVGVITKSKSDFNSDFADIGGLCRKNSIDFIFCDNVNDREIKNYIQNKNTDIILCLGWSQILDAELLSIPKYGSVGFHSAELPYNRGRHPLIWALGMERTASTLFLIIDAVKIYDTELGEYPFPRSEEHIRNLAAVRGVEAGVKYAEAFRVVKMIC